jgi:hypothetical protein
MDLDFDKEIDAILRKARPNRGVLVGDDPQEPAEQPKPTKHVDADAMAAFAENALPEKTRLLYIGHFADCDSCRKLLSRAVLLNSEAAAVAETKTEALVEPVKESAIPWYQSIFRVRNLAFTMGALVLAFSGILGYLVLQRSGGSNAIVSQVEQPEYKRGGPFVSDESAAANVNAATNTMSTAPNAGAPSFNSAANSASVMAPPANVAPAGRVDLARKPADSENNAIKGEDLQLDGIATGGAQPPKTAAAAEPRPPITTDSSISDVLREQDERKADNEVRKEEARDKDIAKRKLSDDRAGSRRDAPPAAAKSGPERSGPLQSKQVGGLYQMSVTRAVGGKTFSNRDGAWYDSAYHGQATLNYRRGTDEYKKLDSGLRSVADKVGGTVVVMWKGKAYRIQ